MIVKSRNGNTYQLSDENAEKVFNLASEIGQAYVKEKTERCVAALQKEAEIQVSAMEKTVMGQKNFLDNHEKAQHEILEQDALEREKLIDLLGQDQTPEYRAMIMARLKALDERLEKLYVENNAKLDSRLESAKQRPKGIIGQLLSRLGL